MNLQGYGFLNYEPVHPSTRSAKWWAILSVPGDITKYYRSLIEKNAYIDVRSNDWLESIDLNFKVEKEWIVKAKTKVTGSAWGSHVSVVKNEIPPNIKYWKAYQNKKIYFEYDPQYLNSNKKHWWIKVFSKELDDIREELGLPIEPNSPLHITIGFQNAR
jgi:hypothetical protein